MFETVLKDSTNGLSIYSAALCTGTALALGILISVVYVLHDSNHSKGFVLSLALMPALIQVVIMMVNGNLGTGIAVMGAFSLVRFRSVPGSSKEISSIFFSMVIGIAVGMGYLTFAVSIAVLFSIFLLVLSKTKFGESSNSNRDLKILIPENLDYTDVFDDLFDKYTKNNELKKVKTTNLGSMYELTYNIKLKDMKKEKEFLDELRCRNGNLTIICSKAQMIKDEL